MLKEFLMRQEVWKSIEFKAERDPAITGNFEVFVDGAHVHSKRLGKSKFPPGQEEFMNILTCIEDAV